MDRCDIDKAVCQLRNKKPLVYCMTNGVANARVADVLSALSASPLMANAIEEADSIVLKADALTINTGMLTAAQFQAMKTAMKTALEYNRPVVLDPVAHFVSPFRSAAIKELMCLRPQIIRGNASEILGLIGKTSGRGVDNCDSTIDAAKAAILLAEKQKCVVAVSGAKDFITTGTKAMWIEGGHRLMEQIPALGCALTGAIGAFAAIVPPFEASILAHCVFSYCGKQAGELAIGPGSFYPIFLDSLYNLRPELMAKEANLQPA